MDTNTLSKWGSILGIPAIIGWYITGYQTAISWLQAGPNSSLPNIFMGAFVLFGVIALAANALTHSKLSKLSAQQPPGTQPQTKLSTPVQLPVVSIPLPIAKPPAIPKIVKSVTIEPRKEWRPLTAKEIVEFIEFVGLRSEIPYPLEAVKFIANDSGRAIADLISRTFLALGYEIIINHDGANYIYPAKSDLSGITIRYPAGEPTKMCFRLGAGIGRAKLSASQVEFPKSDQFNFVQIEIGDWQGSCQWQ